MSKTQEIIELLQDYQSLADKNNPEDYCNHWVRRFFRCWLDGSYNGYNHYKFTCKYIRENKGNHKRMRTFVISEFCLFICKKFDCSYSTAQRAIVKALTSKQLEALNQELIEDSLELIKG